MAINNKAIEEAKKVFSRIGEVTEEGISKSGERCTEHFYIAGTVFKMEYETERLKDYFNWQMRLFRTDAPATAKVSIWTDEIAGDMAFSLDEGNTSGSCELEMDGNVYKIYMLGKSVRVSGYIFAWCAELREGWVIIHPDYLENFIEVSFMLTPLFSRFAADIGMTLIHAAAVGVDGHGVLLTGLSGAGKSSCATACLMNGLDYVSDDAIFLGVEDNRAYPTCSTIHLAPPILKIFPKLQGEEFPSKNGRGEKRHLDISPLKDQFRQGMKIEAIMSLCIDEKQDASIKPMNWNAAVVPLVVSSAHLLGEAQNAPAIKNIMKCLRKLPTYQFRMTGNLTYNALYLEKFIRENIIK